MGGSSGRSGGDIRWIGFSDGALDGGGAFPGGQFVGVGAVFVLHDGIKTGDDALRLTEKSADGGGVFDAFEIVAVFAGGAVEKGEEVAFEVLDKVGADFEGDELGAEGGLGGFLFGCVGRFVREKLEEGIGVGDGGGFVVVRGEAEISGPESGFFNRDGA